MPAAPLPADEAQRLASLLACDILDTPADERFDSITRMAARLCDVPIVLVSLIDERRQWFKSAVGLESGGETPREQAFCAYAILRPREPLVVEDATQDPRFADNPAVNGPFHLRFYAGMPLCDQEGRALGTLCIIDKRPRRISEDQLRYLTDLSACVASLIGLNRSVLALQESEARAKQHAAELEEARRKAEEADRAKSMFLAAMSHEIRTPMTGVLGMADLLAEEPLTPKQLQYVGAIRTSGRHLLTVINDILDFSRIDAGGLTLEEIDFSLGEVLEQTRAILAPQAVDRGLRLTFDLDEHSPPVVQGDPTRLRQVLVNLAGNGLKFTSTGGVEVTVRCTQPDSEHVNCRFEVRDTGIGIPEDRQGELFCAFTQADRSTTRRFGGSGLGLAICRQLVEAMGGRIGLESKPGQGSVFWFDLPFRIGHGASVTETAERAPSSIPPMRVLVAEDVEVNRNLLEAVLTRHGHQVSFALDGAEAVSRVLEQPFDVVLMDVQMPVLDGIEATRRIRALSSPVAAVPIVALTANVMEEERQRCMAAGMNQVLTKPVTWPDLFRTLAMFTRNGAQVAAPSSRPEPVVDLIDRTRLDSLRAMAGEAKFMLFVQNAMNSAVALFAEMLDLRDEPAELAKSAHRLAGSAPSFGLVRIGVLAREIEQRSVERQALDGLIDQLGLALSKTREELVRLGILAG
ncbi:GAF domain-containing hybrid sensor histidine kinase/response regulator [Geminicoccus roseus]|uniref:GAF domain-containing hybrid sensor histidine kinase/response regulator n=1 Tax=Geminicoccus roseus TaxID=404900 RepID=UPI00040C6CD5|nr:GAF domain-containing hybrid sensor histidine kinase/response regulator [Geminicoccus roseus]